MEVLAWTRVWEIHVIRRWRFGWNVGVADVGLRSSAGAMSVPEIRFLGDFSGEAGGTSVEWVPVLEIWDAFGMLVHVRHDSGAGMREALVP